jgi:dienelactone hydrolase
MPASSASRSRIRFSLSTSLSALLLVSLATALWSDEPQRFRFTEPPGPFAVGLKVVEQYDYSRVFRDTTDELGKPVKGERARPLQTLIWYPAQKSSGKRMTVADYGDLLAAETNFDAPAISPHNKRWIAAMQPTLNDAMWAVRDAPLSSGRYPVVIYAPSFSAMAWENADLCEFLASHGYVVIASPDMGAATRNMTNDLPGIDAQARDISFLIGYAKTLPNTDLSAVAVAGFSWGGISNLFAAARDNRIDALVALDGSMRYYPGLVKQAGDVHPEQMTIPLIYFAQGEFTMEDQARYLSDPAKNIGPNVLDAWTHGDLITVRMLGLVHTEHSSMYQRNEDVWKGFADEHKADYGREDGIPGYAWISRYTLNFLDAYLKHDAAALAFLKKTPAENGVPRHFISASFRPAEGHPATIDAFRVELGRQGFSHAAEIYATFKKETPSFKLEEAAIDGWASDLADNNHVLEAIELLKLNVTLYPDSASVYASLAEVYANSNQKQLAIDNYKKALEKDPSNEHAREELKKLEESHTP